MDTRPLKSADLMALFSEAGFDRLEPPILQPANVFLDLAGEDIRRRLLLTQTGDGSELCLRPDYTIPVCRHHIATGTDSGAYCYLGPVFRQRSAGVSEFPQAGVEWLGRADRDAADADILALAVRSAGLLVETAHVIRLGDTALFTALTRALDLPDRWQRRLRAAFGEPNRIARLLDRLGGADPDDALPNAGLLATLRGASPATARQIVDELLSATGHVDGLGRGADEIAERLLEQSELSAQADKNAGAADILRRYLAIQGTPNRAADDIARLAGDVGLDLSADLDRFAHRNALFGERDLKVDSMAFSADFGRRLDYYTGYTFEICRQGEDQQIVGGGRYDALLSKLGADHDIPAAGFAIWLERAGGGEP